MNTRLHSRYDNTQYFTSEIIDSKLRVKYSPVKALAKIIFFIVVWAIFSFLILPKLFTKPQYENFPYEIIIWTMPLFVLPTLLFSLLSYLKTEDFLIIDLRNKTLEVPKLKFKSKYHSFTPKFIYKTILSRSRGDEGHDTVYEFNLVDENGNERPILNTSSMLYSYKKLGILLQTLGMDFEEIEIDER